MTKVEEQPKEDAAEALPYKGKKRGRKPKSANTRGIHFRGIGGPGRGKKGPMKNWTYKAKAEDTPTE